MSSRVKVVIASLLIPSSFAAASVRQTLYSLYADQPRSIVEQRIAVVRNAEEFFRHFVAYFHLAVKRQVFSLPEFKDLEKIDGWCAGDPHVENFGALLSRTGNPFFLMNDKDDAGPCPLTSDVLRLLVSWRFVWDKMPASEIVSAYQAGLTGRAAPEVPKYVRGLLKRAAKKGLYPDSRWVDLDKLKFRKDDELREVPNVVADTLANGLGIEIRRDWKVINVRQRFKIGGGSGGRFRYLILLERRKDEHVLVEYKEIARPATFVYDPPVVPPAQRIMSALRWEAQPVMGFWDRTIEVFGRTFFVRPSWDGQSDVNEKDFDRDDVVPVARYEAYLIGDLHRRSAGMSLAAPKLLEIPMATWETAVRVLVKAEADAFEELRH